MPLFSILPRVVALHCLRPFLLRGLVVLVLQRVLHLGRQRTPLHQLGLHIFIALHLLKVVVVPLGRLKRFVRLVLALLNRRSLHRRQLLHLGLLLLLDWGLLFWLVLNRFLFFSHRINKLGTRIGQAQHFLGRLKSPPLVLVIENDFVFVADGFELVPDGLVVWFFLELDLATEGEQLAELGRHAFAEDIGSDVLFFVEYFLVLFLLVLGLESLPGERAFEEVDEDIYE